MWGTDSLYMAERNQPPCAPPPATLRLWSCCCSAPWCQDWGWRRCRRALSGLPLLEELWTPRRYCHNLHTHITISCPKDLKKTREAATCGWRRVRSSGADGEEMPLFWFTWCGFGHGANLSCTLVVSTCCGSHLVLRFPDRFVVGLKGRTHSY